MLQHAIDLAVAEATGESLCEIERLGFILADPADVDFDPEPQDRLPWLIDWDSVYPCDSPRSQLE